MKHTRTVRWGQALQITLADGRLCTIHPEYTETNPRVTLTLDLPPGCILTVIHDHSPVRRR